MVSLIDDGRWTSDVLFRPWVGATYGDENALGLPSRLLVVGIAHHRQALAASGIDPLLGPALTRAIVARHAADGTFRFFTLVRRTVLGPASTPIDRAPFWAAVAFFNLVQRLYDRPYEPVATADVRASHAAFDEVLRQLAPSHVLVTGLDLWRQMPSPERARRAIETAAAQREVGLYRTGSGRALAMAVPHPASFGYTYEPWHGLIQAFLGKTPGSAG